MLELQGSIETEGSHLQDTALGDLEFDKKVRVKLHRGWHIYQRCRVPQLGVVGICHSIRLQDRIVTCGRMRTLGLSQDGDAPDNGMDDNAVWSLWILRRNYAPHIFQ